MGKYKSFPLSYQWWREKNGAYFIEQSVNCVLKYDYEKNIIITIVALPTDIPYHLCAKIDKYIYCFSEVSPDIMAYDLSINCWSYIKTGLTMDGPLFIGYPWRNKNYLYVVINSSRKVLAFDTLSWNISFVSLFQECNDYYKDTQNFLEISLYREEVYGIIQKGKTVCYVNCNTRKMALYNMPIIDDDIYTVCFDGASLWLSGIKKVIYRWDIKKNTIISLDKFPVDFGYYALEERKYYSDNPVREATFYTSVLVGDYIWYIPQRANQIIAVNIYTLKIEKIYQEQENIYSMKNHDWGWAVQLSYVYDDRYIGLYLLKDNSFIEIDAFTKKYIIKEINDVEDDNLQYAKIQKFRDKQWISILTYWKKVKHFEYIHKNKDDVRNGDKIWKGICR